MIDTNYSIEALEYLLDKECLSEKYYPLIEFKEKLIKNVKKHGYKAKNELEDLSDSKIKDLGIQNEETIKLFRRFLKLYDSNVSKFKEIEKLDINDKERRAYEELYYLPGVKHIRASLYYYSGYKSLKDIASAKPEEIIERTSLAISKYKLDCIVPFVKEIKTHIAVSKALTKE